LTLVGEGEEQWKLETWRKIERIGVGKREYGDKLSPKMYGIYNLNPVVYSI